MTSYILSKLKKKECLKQPYHLEKPPLLVFKLAWEQVTCKMVTGVAAFIGLITGAYIVLVVGLVSYVISGDYLDAVPSLKVTKDLRSLDIDFKRANFSGDIQHYANQTALLSFPGPGISEEACMSAEYFAGDLNLCFWVGKRQLLVSDPYYPKGTPDDESEAGLLASVPAGIPSQFHPKLGLAHTLIPLNIDPKLALYNASELYQVNYAGGGRKRLWIRSFFWSYQGTYTLSSRPFTTFNFSFQWPSLLPSGKPKFIFGLCLEKEIFLGSCSDDAFL
ncbi:hypothetical protein DSO57_1004345 [Entomophthora muscae]|uniref:Uncharacterized protein n=1 Tax=Entomophthora muscae TaxID=34485 RepID=A0ACC2T810_9FUNG|nr:hypothetical protein DSO57_1004345 [Entomophthora muscae]